MNSTRHRVLGELRQAGTEGYPTDLSAVHTSSLALSNHAANERCQNAAPRAHICAIQAPGPSSGYG